MQTGYFNELVWHFAGYIKTFEDIATIRLDYDATDGYPVEIHIKEFGETGDGKSKDEELPGGLHSTAIPELIFDDISDFYIEGYSAAEFAENLDIDEIIDRVLATQDPPLDGQFEPPNLPPPGFPIYFFYEFFGPVTYLFNLKSENLLNDSDVLVNTSIDVSPIGYADLDEFLEDASDPEWIDEAVALADDQTPDYLTLDMSDPEGGMAELSEMLALRAKQGIKPENEGDDESEGILLENEEREENENEEEGEPVAPNDLALGEGEPSPGDEEETQPEEAEPEPQPDQVIHLGSNEAINAAAIVDTSEAGSSMIILGDYYESNAIVQTNIYSFNDNSNISQILIENGILGETNVVLNDADISRDTGDALISAPLGYSLPGYNFHVDYVMGDFFDLNMIKQFNDLTDNDSVVYETHTQNYLIETGDNSLINAAQILDLYMQYDMIIVEGVYNEVNLIKQTNILLDADNVTFDDSFGGVISDGNVLINEASIQNIGGGELFKPVTEDVHQIADSIENLETSLFFANSEMDFGMAVNLPTNANVLYVTGDFYQLNAIFQTNILSDIDSGLILDNPPDNSGLTQTVNVADADEPADPVYATGDNLASNEATIIDYDSQSEFQYLDGQLYEQDILIQVDLIAPDDEAMKLAEEGRSDELVSEIVAFAGSAEETPNNPQDELFVPAQDMSEGGDVMGSMMV